MRGILAILGFLILIVAFALLSEVAYGDPLCNQAKGIYENLSEARIVEIGVRTYTERGGLEGLEFLVEACDNTGPALVYGRLNLWVARSCFTDSNQIANEVRTREARALARICHRNEGRLP